MKKNGGSDYYDYNLIAVIILLIGFGLVMLYSTTSYTAEIRYNNDMYFFRKQAIYSGGAVLMAIGFSLIFNYHILWTISRMVYILALALMALTRSPLGLMINGARRWIRLGPISFQPSEIAKIAVIVYVPMLIVRMGKNFKGLKAMAEPLLAGLIQALSTLVFTRNLSTAIIIMAIDFVIVFIAHPQTKPFLIALAGLAAAAVIAVLAIAGGAGGDFRSRRVLVWLHPEEYSSEGGYQIMQALYALGSGGLFGKGLGNGTQKLGAVPEAENDMIFSIICEELGIFGGIIVVLLFIYLLYRLFFIAQNAPDLYGSLMVAGIFVHIALQVILNICVVLNLIPTTGITLPFVSYGGTSVVILMSEMAIALSVSRMIRFRSPERDLWGDVVKESWQGSR